MYIKATTKLINKIIDSLLEKDIYKNIGAEDLFSNRNELDVFFRNMFCLQQPRVLKGYKYRYYYFKTSSNIEFILTAQGDKAPNSSNFVGMDMHFCSNSRVIGDINKVIDRDKSAARIIVSDQVGNGVVGTDHRLIPDHEAGGIAARTGLVFHGHHSGQRL